MSGRRAKYTLDRSMMAAMLRLPASTRVVALNVTRDPDIVHVTVEGDGVPPMPQPYGDAAEMAFEGLAESVSLPLPTGPGFPAGTAEDLMTAVWDAVRACTRFGVSDETLRALFDESLTTTADRQRAVTVEQIRAARASAVGGPGVVNGVAPDAAAAQVPDGAEEEARAWARQGQLAKLAATVRRARDCGAGEETVLQTVGHALRRHETDRQRAAARGDVVASLESVVERLTDLLQAAR